MPRKTKVNSFSVKANRSLMTVFGEGGEFNFTTAEVQTVIDLLGVASKMRDLKVLPPNVVRDSIYVKFNEDNTLTLGGKERVSTLPLEWEQVDEVVQAIHVGKAQGKDQILLDKKPGSKSTLDKNLGDTLV